VIFSTAILALSAAAVVTPDGGAGLSSYISYGPLGLMVLGFLTGQLVPGRTAKRIEDENDRLRAMVEDKLLPLVEKNTAVTTEAIRVLGELQEERRVRRRSPAT
jgi:hypothetical protein